MDYSPWLGDSTDTSGACGFQPNATPVYYRPDHLVFSTQPGWGLAGQPFSTQPVVQVIDENNNLATQSGAAVTLAIGNNPSGGTLSGTTTINAVGGIATFSGLSINNAASVTRSRLHPRHWPARPARPSTSTIRPMWSMSMTITPR
jgi:hypothetical protein